MGDIPVDTSIRFPSTARRSQLSLGESVGSSSVVSSLLIGAYAIFIIATGFAFVAQEVAGNRFPTALGLRTHIVASGIALITGPFQFLRPLRHQCPVVHRTIGRIYVVAPSSAHLRAARLPCSAQADWSRDLDSSPWQSRGSPAQSEPGSRSAGTTT